MFNFHVSANGFTGYDVWLGNVRGNRFSRKHTSLDPDRDDTFWDWGWDEHAAFDIPSMVDKALSVSGADTLQYIGYSQVRVWPRL